MAIAPGPLPQRKPSADLLLWAHPQKSRLKRFIDFGGAALLIILLAPLFVAIACAVLLTSGRPLIHRRRVVGPEGEFDAFKFRTMRPDADTVLKSSPVLRRKFESNFKLKQDPRVTPIGRWLRRYSLDELPQLYNVLLGQMSLVGPRMITAAELEKYGDYQPLLLSVKPGLTGYWQVHGRQTVSYAERVQMDVAYIQTWSLRKDLHLLLVTPLRVIRGEGAY